jgi:hypothetical protein
MDSDQQAAPVPSPDYQDVGEYCVDVMMQDMNTRRGFIEVLEQIDPVVKENIIFYWCWHLRISGVIPHAVTC